MNKYLILLLLAGCATVPTEPRTYTSVGCPVEVRVPIEHAATVVPIMQQADARCRQLYGKDACLLKFIERSPQNYWAICRRNR